MTNMQYFTATMMISVQNTNERLPSATVSLILPAAFFYCLIDVQGARTNIAIHNTKSGKQRRRIYFAAVPTVGFR